MDNDRITARNLRKNKNFKEALPIYIELWKVSDECNIDKWLGWEYAYTCKMVDQIDDAIKISKIIFKKYPEFKNNTDLLCWCLYEKYIKNIDEDCTLSNFNRILAIANFITNNTKNSEKTAFSYTINGMLKQLKKNNEFITENVVYWLDTIDPNYLSELPIIYNFNKKEGMSSRENYYSFKTKALLKLKNYEKCILVCEEALEQICKFHHDNNIWWIGYN